MQRVRFGVLASVLICTAAAWADDAPDLSNLKQGDGVMVLDGATWTPATFTRQSSTRVLVHFDDGRQAWVTPDKVKPGRSAPGATDGPQTKAPVASYPVGTAVEAKNNAFWKPAKVINRRGDWYLLEWQGFGNQREWVEPWRIRTPGSSYDLQGWYTNPPMHPGDNPPRPTPGEPTDKRDNPNAPDQSAPHAGGSDGLKITEAVRAGRDILPVAPDGWAYKPAPARHLGNVQPTVLPPLADMFAKYRGLRIAGNSAILVATSAMSDKNSGLVAVNLAYNSTRPYELEGAPIPMAISPNGDFIAAHGNNRDFKSASRLDLYKITAGKAVRQISFIPEDEKTQIFDAQFVDEKLLLTCTDDQLACWDFATATNLWKMPVQGGGTITRAPDGKTFAVSTTEGVVLLEPTEGKVLGVLDGDPVNDLAFTSDGKTLYGTTPASLSVWDLEKGAPIYTLGLPNGVTGGAGGKLVAIDRDFCIVGQYLFSTAKRCVVWEYDGDAPMAASGGRVFTIYADRKMRMLVSAVLPQPSALKAAKDVKEATMVLRPGASVAIDLQNEGSDADKQAVIAAITRRMQAANITVDPNAPIRIVAKTETSTQSRDYTVHGFGIPFGRTESVTITNKTTTLSVMAGDKICWSVSRGTSNDPGMFVHFRADSTIQQTIDSHVSDTCKWLAESQIPTYLAGPQDLTILPSSRWALGGVKDK